MLAHRNCIDLYYLQILFSSYYEDTWIEKHYGVPGFVAPGVNENFPPGGLDKPPGLWLKLLLSLVALLLERPKQEGG
ncbi:hypothetical protein ES705_16519 [subsurface metagenome]